MQEIERGKWRDAARDGGVIGAVVLVLTALGIVAGSKMGLLVGYTEFVAMIALIYFFTRRRSLKYGDRGFGYGQSITYIVMMMLFTGFIAGIGEWLTSIIVPEYYDEKVRVMLAASSFVKNNPQIYEPLMPMMVKLMKNPLFLSALWMLSYVLYGGVLGLFISAFTKRVPNIFKNRDE